MQVKFLKKDGFDYKFFVQDTRNDVLNAIRRTIMLHVPVFGVQTVSVYKNESVMPDEMLAHRLGLIPIVSNDIDDNEHHLYLKKTSGKVYSGDIEGNLDIPLQNIELTFLNDNKSLELELNVSKGTGTDHIKFSPASVFFNNLVDIKQNGDVEDIDKLCPKCNLEKKANKIVLKDPYSCDLCRYCETKSGHNLQIIFNDSDFVFTIEPFGNLDLNIMVSSAVDYLNNELSELKSQLSGDSLDSNTEKPKAKKSKSKTSKSLESKE